MIDQISLDRIEFLHPKIKDKVKTAYLEACANLKGKAILRLAYTIRTFNEQDGLYALGRTVVNPQGKSTTKPMGNIVTWAKGGQSYHNYALAWDIVLLVDKNGDGTFESASWETDVDFDGDGQADWREVVESFTRIGAEWGGNWNKPKQDMPHFQMTLGHSIADLQVLHEKQIQSKQPGFLNL